MSTELTLKPDSRTVLKAIANGKLLTCSVVRGARGAAITALKKFGLIEQTETGWQLTEAGRQYALDHFAPKATKAAGEPKAEKAPKEPKVKPIHPKIAGFISAARTELGSAISHVDDRTLSAAIYHFELAEKAVQRVEELFVGKVAA